MRNANKLHKEKICERTVRFTQQMNFSLQRRSVSFKMSFPLLRAGMCCMYVCGQVLVLQGDFSSGV